MSRCLSCAATLDESAGRYHATCLRVLFGTERLPKIDVDLARLHTLALAMVGRASVSGMQRKLSVQLDSTRATLQIAMANGRYLLKPQAGTFPNLPENEWVTQRLAALVGIEVPPSALVELPDDTWAYVVRRFDRLEDGRKLAMEDFCQLAELPPSGKYDGSAERCGKFVQQFTSEPLVEQLRLYRQFVFTWWVGNGDLHLKNLALLRAIVAHPEFAAGALHTGFIDDHLTDLPRPECPPARILSAALLASRRRTAGAGGGAGKAVPDPWGQVGAWRLGH